MAKLVMCLALQFGALVGVPMRQDEIERISRLMNGTAVVENAHRERGGDPPQ